MNEKELTKLIYKINMSHEKTKFNMKELDEILKMIYYYHFVIKKEVLNQEDFIDWFILQRKGYKELYHFYDYMRNIVDEIFYIEWEVKSLNYGYETQEKLKYLTYDGEYSYFTRDYMLFFEIREEDKNE